jgi:hypothetical protein
VDSSCYTEYITLHDASHETVFLWQLLSEIGYEQQGPTILYCDNDAASQLAEDQVWHSRVKHIRTKYHYVREQVLDSQLKVTHIHTKDNAVDIFTKPLGHGDFKRIQYFIGLRNDTFVEEEY